jgi:hypothetical protein
MTALAVVLASIVLLVGWPFWLRRHVRRNTISRTEAWRRIWEREFQQRKETE